jgi:hypothetical protein
VIGALLPPTIAYLHLRKNPQSELSRKQLHKTYKISAVCFGIPAALFVHLLPIVHVMIVGTDQPYWFVFGFNVGNQNPGGALIVYITFGAVCLLAFRLMVCRFLWKYSVEERSISENMNNAPKQMDARVTAVVN